MSRYTDYAPLTPYLSSSQAAQVALSFDELEKIIVGGLADSAKKYPTMWTNKEESRSWAKSWLDAGRRASLDVKGKRVVFTLDSSLEPSELAADVVDESTPQELTEYVESSLSLERDLEDQIVSHLDSLEPGLTLVSRQVRSDVGILDLLAKDRDGQTVIIELKAGEAKDSSIRWLVQRERGYGAACDSGRKRLSAARALGGEGNSRAASGDVSSAVQFRRRDGVSIRKSHKGPRYASR